MRSIILCKSTHHGNTAKIAAVIADELGATVVDPEDVDPESLADFDLVGIGSGVYFGRPHSALRQLVVGLRRVPRRSFLFSTSGLPAFGSWWHRGLRRSLRRRGSEVVGEFACRGWDTVGPLWLIGGINRRHPDERDLRRAREFARSLAVKMSLTPTTAAES